MVFKQLEESGRHRKLRLLKQVIGLRFGLKRERERDR